MLYCSDCQVLTVDSCPICDKKAKKLRAPKANDPVYFYYADFSTSNLIEPLLMSAEIPYSKMGKLGAALAMKTGSMFEDYKFYVPYGALDSAIDVITGTFGADEAIMRGLINVKSNEQAKLDDTQSVKEQYTSPDALDARRALHARFTIAEVPFHDWLISELSLKSGMKILDIGCGSGDLWLHNDFPDDMDITLADLSEGMVETARERTADVKNVRFSYTTADAQDLQFDDAQFDLVIAAHMLYHVPDLNKALGEIKRVLKPGGRLCATTMSEKNMRELYELADRHGILMVQPSKKFNMETGRAALNEHFDDIRLSKHESSLQITEAQPLIDYVKSLSTFTKISPEAVGELGREVERKIERDGSFDITKLACMFIARKDG